MLTHLRAKSFKCLTNFDEDLAPLTLLTGFNAAGKSSVVQTLGVLRQTALEAEWAREMRLNGSSIQLGTMADVIDRNVGGNGFELGIAVPGATCDWIVSAEDRTRQLEAPITEIRLATPDWKMVWRGDGLASVPIQCLMPTNVPTSRSAIANALQEPIRRMTYIGAERLGPREVYVARHSLSRPDVGSNGEHTPWCLEQFADKEANPSLRREGIAPIVRLTVRAWMDQLFPGFDYQIRRVDAANLLTMSIRTSAKGDYFRPTNVGFGLTHVLPIVTAAVAAQPGDVLVIENPETHLHPAGQSDVGFFLALCAASGVQTIVETHSDHVVNGVRRAIKAGQVMSKDCKVMFFRSVAGEDMQPKSQVEQIEIGNDGRITTWPAGFFDQMELDLDTLFSL